MYQVMTARPLETPAMHVEVATLEEAQDIADEVTDEQPYLAVEILNDWEPIDAGS